jgi:sulfite reductase (NADPH) flavoprotein alpha-component
MSQYLPTPHRLLAQAAQETEIHSPKGFLSVEHGFLPAQPPPVQFPASHKAWDEAIKQLPELWAAGRQRELANLPLLSGTAENLPDCYVWRAVLALGIMAHAYVRRTERNNTWYELYVPPAPEKKTIPLPEVIAKPWQEVSARVGRTQPVFGYFEHYLYNWQFRPEVLQQTPASGIQNLERTVENCQMLIPITGSETERVFSMTMFETHYTGAPLIRLTAAASQAIENEDIEALSLILSEITEVLQKMTFSTLLKASPNNYSTFEVNPLIWSKTVAPFAASTRPGEPGLSGGGSPIFHLLDAFFGRTRFSSQLGHEIIDMAKWEPEYPRAYVEAVQRIGVSEFVQHHPNPQLQILYFSALEAYTGKRGWLGVHRLKVYGFMELGFKAGRTQTNGGFSGEIDHRGWDALDDTLEEARLERYSETVTGCPFAHKINVIPQGTTGDNPIRQVVLKTAGNLKYQPGDRLGIFPKNNPELIEKTLSALQAKGNELIRLSSTWRHALQQLANNPDSVKEMIPLAEWLAYAKIRPLTRPIAQALYSLTRCQALKEILDAQREDQYELADAIAYIVNENYNPRRLWKAHPWDAESLVRIVPPEHFRIYSISSAPESTAAGEIHLTISKLTFESAFLEATPVERKGNASNYLSREDNFDDAIPVQIVRPSRFFLPEDPAVPVVMFAGGTGIAPFRGFLQDRIAKGAKQNWLFLGVHTPETLPYKEELTALAATGSVEIRVIFSRAQGKLRVVRNADGAALKFVPGEKGYVDKLILEPTDSAVLWKLLRSPDEGGPGGYFYICGQTGFAHTVLESLQKLIAQHLGPEHSPEDLAVRQYIRRLSAQNRLMQDIFTTFASAGAPGVRKFQLYDVSEVSKHNTEEAGYWVIIQGKVYDLTEFAHLHPGGAQIIYANSGTDCTRSYEKAEHHLNAEVHSLLDLYKIGQIRHIDFGQTWGLALRPGTGKGIVYLSISDLYKYWTRALFKVVEVENSLRNNYGLRYHPLTGNDNGNTLTHQKVELLLETHANFINYYLNAVILPEMQHLWNLSVGLGAPNEPLAIFSNTLHQILTSEAAEKARNKITALAQKLTDAPKEATTLNSYLLFFQQTDIELAGALIELVRRGVMLFEEYESEVIQQAGRELVKVLMNILSLIMRYYQQLDTKT